MDKLWAPWRIRYIKNTAKKDKACVFCRAVKRPGADYSVFRTLHSTVRLNIYPYNNGHLLVSPKRHIGDLSGLTSQETLDLWAAVEYARAALERVLKPEGFNIGVNLGRSAGAGITGHVHIHIVPRWNGDTNFMPVLYGAKIISQSLDELRKQLRAELRKMPRAGIEVC